MNTCCRRRASEKAETYHSDLAADFEAAQLVLLVVQHALVRGERDDCACSLATQDRGEVGHWVEALAVIITGGSVGDAMRYRLSVESSSLPDVGVDEVDTGVLDLGQVQ